MNLVVYVAVAECYHGGEMRILGVYATEDAAKAAWPKPPLYYDQVTIEPYSVEQTR